jgi:hypothetical protein
VSWTIIAAGYYLIVPHGDADQRHYLRLAISRGKDSFDAEGGGGALGETLDDAAVKGLPAGSRSASRAWDEAATRRHCGMDNGLLEYALKALTSAATSPKVQRSDAGSALCGTRSHGVGCREAKWRLRIRRSTFCHR